MMLGRYTDETLNVAACLWASILDMRRATTSLDPDEASLARHISASFDRLGVAVVRYHVLALTEHLEAAWYDAEPTCGKCFDEDFVQSWITDNIDWTSRDHPFLRKPIPAPPLPAYDVAITLVLNAVVRTGGGEPAAVEAAKQLLSSIEERNSCRQGSDIGVDAVTEFSIGSAGEAIDIDPISDETTVGTPPPPGRTNTRI